MVRVLNSSLGTGGAALQGCVTANVVVVSTDSIEEVCVEKVMLVCDTCGKPAVETVGFKVGGRTLQRDYCQQHLSELLEGSRTPKRGRRLGSKNAATKTTRKSTKKTTATRKRTGAKRRGRPRKRSAA